MLDDFLQRQPYNAAADFIDTNVARGLGDKVAFIDPQRALTYGELQARTRKFAAALYSLGLQSEDRVALILPDTVDFPVVFWGLIRAGIIAVPLNPLLTQQQYQIILADSRASALIVASSLFPQVAGAINHLPHLRTLVVVGEVTSELLADHRVHGFEEILARETGDFEIADTVSDEVAFWLYTSGSSGEPKGVKHVHSALAATARLFGQGVLGIREDDVVFSAAKLFFAYGLGNAMTFPLSVGATAVLWSERPTPDAVLNVMARHQPTIFYAVPSLYASVLAHRALSRGAGSDRLRICVSAGEALPAQIGRRWKEVVGVDVLDGLGSTEMLQTFLSNRPGDVRYGSTGKPVAGYDVKIVDEQGREVAEGEVGELVVRGPSAAEGYWNQRAKSRRTFQGEWTYTGDKFMRDADGYFYYCGRTDDMFKVNGMWVSPFDVEAALASHEAVLEAAVIGKKDADGLVKPKAFVVLKNGYDHDERLLDLLKGHVKEHAGPWKYPRWIDIRSDLPRTATGKVQRFKLREEEQGSGIGNQQSGR